MRVRVGHVRNRKFLTLLGSWVWRHQICWEMRRVGGDTAGDLPRRLLVDGMRRVSPDVGTEDGDTGVSTRI